MMKIATSLIALIAIASIQGVVQANDLDSKEDVSTKLSMTRELGGSDGDISAARAKLIQDFHDIFFKFASSGETERWQADTEVDDDTDDSEEERNLQPSTSCDFCGTQGSCGRSSSLGTYFSVDVDGSFGDLWLVTCEYPDVSAPNCFYPPNYDTDKIINTLGPGVSIGEASLQCPCCTFLYPRADAGNPPYSDSRCATPGNCDFVERICEASSATFTCPVGSVMFIAGGGNGGASLTTDEGVIAFASQDNGCFGSTSSVTCSDTLVALIAADDCNCVTCSGSSVSLGRCVGPIPISGEGVCASKDDICDALPPPTSAGPFPTNPPPTGIPPTGTPPTNPPPTNSPPTNAPPTNPPPTNTPPTNPPPTRRPTTTSSGGSIAPTKEPSLSFNSPTKPFSASCAAPTDCDICPTGAIGNAAKSVTINLPSAGSLGIGSSKTSTCAEWHEFVCFFDDPSGECSQYQAALAECCAGFQQGDSPQSGAVSYTAAKRIGLFVAALTFAVVG